MNLTTRCSRLALLVALFGVFLAGSAHAKAIEGVVNINTASIQELTLLPGIGKSKAEQIVQMRQNKPFAAVDDLKAVRGLGAKRLDSLRPHLVLNGPTTAKTISEVKKAGPTPLLLPGTPPPAAPKI